MKSKYTRAEKDLMRKFAMKSERPYGVVKVRFQRDGDTRAFCADGTTYLILPTNELFKEARAASLKD